VSDAPEDVDWVGEAHFRVLGYYFSLHWTAAELADPVLAVFDSFRVPPDPREHRIPPTPNVPAVYTLVHTGSRTRLACQLFYGDSKVFDADEADVIVRHVLWHIGDEAIRRTGSYLLVHAGAVATEAGRCLVLPGASGSGKTTLVTALVRAGFDYLSDEAAAIDPVSRHVFPFARPLALKSGSLPLFPDLAETVECIRVADELFVPPSALRPDPLAGPGPVDWIVAIGHEPRARTELSELSAAEGLFELGRHAINLSQYGSRALPLLADVARGARSYRLVSGDLAEAVDAMLGIVGGDARGAGRFASG
jgi:hypothetical protein